MFIVIVCSSATACLVRVKSFCTVAIEMMKMYLIECNAADV